MQLTFWGVRGTAPQSGSEYQYYGGHTSCTSLRVGKDLLVFDAGSGLVNLSQYLEQETDRPQAVYFFITHGHLDHIIGLMGFSWLWKSRCPFEIHFISASTQWISEYGFENKDRAPGVYEGVHEDAKCRNFRKADFERRRVYQHAGNGIQSVLQTLLCPPYFPLSLKESKAPIFYHDLKDAWNRNGWNITAFPLNHPGGSAGYRFEGHNYSLAFVTDTAPIDSQPFYNWLNGVDLLIHDAMFNDEESDLYPDWGHSSVRQVADLANKVSAKNLILYHHHPYHTDADLKKLEHQAQSIFPRSSMAKQGDTFSIEKIPDIL